MKKTPTSFGPKVIHALWWNQPYASMMLHGKIETRNQPTKVRGKVLICSCKKHYTAAIALGISGARQLNRIDVLLGTEKSAYQTLPLGQAIAIGDLVDCRPMTHADEDKCYVKYRDGLYCWIFENVQAIEQFPLRGKQGWSILDAETIDKIKLLSSSDESIVHGISNLRTEIADEVYDCNASLFIQDCLAEIVPDLTFAQKRDIVKARTNNWKVLPGEQCRMYTWDKGSDEEISCVEIPAMAAICSDLDLWP